MSITENLYNLVSMLADGDPIKKKTSLNLKKIEFIDGNKLKEHKRKAFDTLAKDPLVSFGTVLRTIENSIYSPQPESVLRSNVQKFLSEENLYILEVDNTYKYRPDLISQIFYGNQEYYHLVLMANGMKTFLEFIPEKTNHLIVIFKPATIAKILNY